MPAWNRLQYLPEAVQSVLDQSMPDFELIVIDDGSTDGSLEWLAKQTDHRLKIRRQPHAGISAALNHGLHTASGEWIAHLDSDDVWDSMFLQQQLAMAEAHPGARAIYSRAEAAGNLLQPKGIFRGTPPAMPDDALGSLLLGDFTCNITVIARRADILSVGGWRKEFPHGEDWDLWLRVARLGPFQFNPRVLARYREHGGNITQKCWHDLPEMRIEILQSHFSDPELPESALRWRESAFRRQHIDGAMAAFSSGLWKRGWVRLQRAFSEDNHWHKTTVCGAMAFFSWCVAPRLRWLTKFQNNVTSHQNHSDPQRVKTPI